MSVRKLTVRMQRKKTSTEDIDKFDHWIQVMNDLIKHEFFMFLRNCKVRRQLSTTMTPATFNTAPSLYKKWIASTVKISRSSWTGLTKEVARTSNSILNVTSFALNTKNLFLCN